MSLLWYYRPEHTQGGRNPSMHQVSHAGAGLGQPAASLLLQRQGIRLSVSLLSWGPPNAGG